MVDTRWRVIVGALALSLLLAGCTGADDPSAGTPSPDPSASSTNPSATDSGAPNASAQVEGCPAGTLVSTAADLSTALLTATPGDVILLAPGTYAGSFRTSASGTAAVPLVLCGTRDAVLDGGAVTSGYTLHLDGAAHWTMQGFTITGGQKGLMLDGASFNTLTDLAVGDTGDEAVHFRANSTDNVIQGSTISGAGLRTPQFGEGVYVGTAASNWCEITACQQDASDRNRILNNTISGTTAESIDVKEGTTGGEITGNTLDGTGMAEADSLLDIKGSSYTISANTGTGSPADGAQVHAIDEAPGSGNLFAANSFTVGGDGYAINVVGDARALGNRVLCDNTVLAAPASRLSNIDCAG